MINKGLFTSDKSNWETPPEVFNSLDDIFNFTIDVCADNYNHKCSNWFGEHIVGIDYDNKPICKYTTDGLDESWKDHICWMNPPYGREIGKWVEKAYNESISHRIVVVGLLPARTDTKWAHEHCFGNNCIIGLVKGRIKFLSDAIGNKPQPAPFPSMIIVWGLYELGDIDRINQIHNKMSNLNYVKWVRREM